MSPQTPILHFKDRLQILNPVKQHLKIVLIASCKFRVTGRLHCICKPTRLEAEAILCCSLCKFSATDLHADWTLVDPDTLLELCGSPSKAVSQNSSECSKTSQVSFMTNSCKTQHLWCLRWQFHRSLLFETMPTCGCVSLCIPACTGDLALCVCVCVCAYGVRIMHS